MSYASVLSDINSDIIANGVNAITGPVLNPILVAILDFANDTIGDLGDLDTTDQTSIVNAINEVLASVSNSGITIHVGTANPNQTPPASYEIGDWYLMQSGGTGTNRALWINYISDKWMMFGGYGGYDMVSNSTNFSSSAWEKYFVYTGTGGHTFSLPTASVSRHRELVIINQGSGNLSTSVSFIDYDGSSVSTIANGTRVAIYSDGTNWIRV